MKYVVQENYMKRKNECQQGIQEKEGSASISEEQGEEEDYVQ